MKCWWFKIKSKTSSYWQNQWKLQPKQLAYKSEVNGTRKTFSCVKAIDLESPTIYKKTYTNTKIIIWMQIKLPWVPEHKHIHLHCILFNISVAISNRGETVMTMSNLITHKLAVILLLQYWTILNSVVSFAFEIIKMYRKENAHISSDYHHFDNSLWSETAIHLCWSDSRLG